MMHLSVFWGAPPIIQNSFFFTFILTDRKRQKLITEYFAKDKEKPWYELKYIHRRKFFNGAALSVTYSLQLTHIKEGILLKNLFGYLERIFSHIIKRLLRNYENPESTKMVIILESDQLDTPLVIPLRFLNEYSAQLILAQIAALVQSKRSLAYNESMIMTVGTVSYIKSIGHNNKMAYISSNNMESLKSKKFIKVFDVEAQDQNCFLRALTYSVLLNQKKTVIVNKKTQSSFDRKAKKLGETCGIIWNCPVQLGMVASIEAKLKAMITLIKFKDSGNGFEIMYAGNENFSSNPVFILIIPPYNSNYLHAVGITNSSKLFWSNSVREIMCNYCKAIVKANHSCPGNRNGIKCYSCSRMKCPDKIINKNINTITCILCSYSFMGNDCYLSHLASGKRGGLSLCERRYKCRVCFNTDDKTPRKLHIHGMKKCAICQSYVQDSLDNKHHCHMVIPRKIEPPVSRIMAFDVESSILEESECDSPKMENDKCLNCQNKICKVKIHKALVIVSFTCCEDCKSDNPDPMDPNAECATCGWRCNKCKLKKDGPYCSPRNSDSHGNYCRSPYVKFIGKDCIKLFIDYITDKRRKDFTIFAHGSSCYDS